MSEEVKEARAEKWRQTKEKLTELSAQGKTFAEASEEIALSVVTIKVYARRLGLQFKKGRRA
jgi:DNA-binding NarL/FixJ family response regulator